MGVRGTILGGFIASLLAVAFLALDYLVRPLLPGYFGDNDIYALVVLLGVEFIVVWRTTVAVMSRK